MANSKKIIIIGWDGATWTLLDKYMSEGLMPNLSHIIHDGVRGTLMSTFPSVTLAAWTSIFTGVNPGKHGMIDFRMRINGKFEIINPTFRKVDSLWKILGNKGSKVIVVNDPVSYPPEAINGIMTTGMLTPHNSSNFVHPPSLKNEIERVAQGYICEPSFDWFEMASKDRWKAYDILEEMAQKHARVGLHLAKNYDWDLLAVIFTSTDRLQHFYWNRQGFIKKHYILLDTMLKDFLDIASDTKANMFIVSDHGFGAANRAVYINTWLINNGFQISKKSILRSALSGSGLTLYRIAEIVAKLHLSDVSYKIFNVLPQRVKQALPLESKENVQTEYENSQAFSITYQGIYINDKLSKNEYEQVRNSLTNKLYNLKDGNRKLVEKIYRKEDVIWGPCENMAPDLIVQPIDGYCLSTHMNPIEVDQFTDRGAVLTGNHRPDGIFVGHGPDIVQGMKYPSKLYTWDITPTLMHILRMPIPGYMDGEVAQQIFESSSELFNEQVRSYHEEANRIRTRLGTLRKRFERK